MTPAHQPPAHLTYPSRTGAASRRDWSCLEGSARRRARRGLCPQFSNPARPRQELGAARESFGRFHPPPLTPACLRGREGSGSPTLVSERRIWTKPRLAGQTSSESNSRCRADPALEGLRGHLHVLLRHRLLPQFSVRAERIEHTVPSRARSPHLCAGGIRPSRNL